MSNGGPPNKFPQFVDLESVQTMPERAALLGDAWQKFFDTYHAWPNAWVESGGVVYIGLYGND